MPNQKGKTVTKRNTVVRHNTAGGNKATSKPTTDYDSGIREQLEQYGLELNDIVAVLEEDPEMLQYVKQGKKGESLASCANRTDEGTGACASGVRRTTQLSSARAITGCNGNDFQLGAQKTGDYFTVTYHSAETRDSLTYAPKGAILSWDNQDAPQNRVHPNPTKQPGGYKFGHVTVKTGETSFFSDHKEKLEGNVNLVLHKGRNNGPRYGSLSYVSFPKDVTFSPELVHLAQMRKKERETDRQIPEAEMPQKPRNLEDFLKKNPRIGYLALKSVNPNVPFELTADGGAKLLAYYNKLPANSPERAALNLLGSKNIKNPMDYVEVNKAVEEVSDKVLRLRNPEAYATRQPASNEQISYLYNMTPTYIYQLQQAMTGNAKRMTSTDYKEYISNLDENSAEYQAISELAKRGLTENTNPVEVKLVVANVAKDHREVKPEEIDALFENTPALVYNVQKEFGTQKAGGIRITSELHDYYDKLPKGSPERRAIDELAMAHIEASEVKEPKLSEAVQAMAHHYNPNREAEPKPTVHLPSQSAQKTVQTKAPTKQNVVHEDREAVRNGLKKMSQEQWASLVDDYKKIQLNKGEVSETLKRQAAEAQQHFEATLKNLFANDGNANMRESMRQGAELLDQYLKLEDGKNKSLDGFIAFMENKNVDNKSVDKDKGIKNPLLLRMMQEKDAAR